MKEMEPKKLNCFPKEVLNTALTTLNLYNAQRHDIVQLQVVSSKQNLPIAINSNSNNIEYFI
jgi:hypothetical protein